MASDLDVISYSTGPPDPTRPAWQQTLFASPENGRCRSQHYLIMKVKFMEDAVSILCKENANWDFNNPEVLHAVCCLTKVMVFDGSPCCRRYYASPRILNKIQKFYSTSFFHCLEQDLNQTSPAPDTRIQSILAAVELSAPTLLTARGGSDENLSLIDTCNQLTALDTPNFLALSDYYLKVMINAPFDMLELTGLLKTNSDTLKCDICFNSASLPRAMLSEVLFYINSNVNEVFSETILPSYAFHSVFNTLDYQLKRLSGMFIRVIKASGLTQSDLESERWMVKWWETTAAYLSLLRDAIRQAKEQIPHDFYTIATLTQQLVTAIVSGVAEYVSYTEVKSLCEQMESALTKCKAWAPPFKKLEIENDLEIITKEVLPFLRNTNPTSYKNTAISVFTPGFLDIYVLDNVFPRLLKNHAETCGNCGGKSVVLLKCSGCQNAYFCDKECQTKGWKNHKEACKEAQKEKEKAKKKATGKR